MFKNKYRIVRDIYSGFEAQVKYWWFPFCWKQISENNTGCNTHRSIEQAERLCRNHSKKVVKYVEV